MRSVCWDQPAAGLGFVASAALTACSSLTISDLLGYLIYVSRLYALPKQEGLDLIGNWKGSVE
jgi:hypothetical protein